MDELAVKLFELRVVEAGILVAVIIFLSRIKFKLSQENNIEVEIAVVKTVCHGPRYQVAQA